MATVNLSFEFAGNGPSRVRTATVLIPFDWDAPKNLGTLRFAPDGTFFVDGGHPLVVAMGGGDAAAFYGDFGLNPLGIDRASRFAAWAQAIVIYPDPVSVDSGVPVTLPDGTPLADSGNSKFNSGVAGESGWMEDVDDVGFILELMHRVRMMLAARINERWRAGVEGLSLLTRVLNPDKFFLVGWSVGASMCYRMALEAPLVHPDDLTYEYKFNAMFVNAGSVGGFRHARERLYPSLRVDFSPAPFGKVQPTITRSYPAAGSVTDPNVRIFHLQGAKDSQFPAQWLMYQPDPPEDFFFHDGTENPAGGPRKGACFVGISLNSKENYEKALYSDAEAEDEARVDYPAEYGLGRWITYKGLAGPPGGDPIIVDAIVPGTKAPFSGTVEEAFPDRNLWPDPVLESQYFLTSKRHLVTFGAPNQPPEVVYMLVAEMIHEWSFGTFAVTQVILDFFDGVYPPP